jgi:hypothetical protein
MDTIEVNGKEYNPEDLDAKGTPYKDAVSVSEEGDTWKRYSSSLSPVELKAIIGVHELPSVPSRIKIDVKKNRYTDMK